MVAYATFFFYAKIHKMKYIKDMYEIVARPKNLIIRAPKPKIN